MVSLPPALFNTVFLPGITETEAASIVKSRPICPRQSAAERMGQETWRTMTWVQRLAEVEKESVECQRKTAEEGAEEDLQSAAMLNETAKVSIPEMWVCMCVVLAIYKASVQLQASPIIGEGSNPHKYKKMQEYKVFPENGIEKT